MEYVHLFILLDIQLLSMAKKGIDGSNWMYEVYFAPEADKRGIVNGHYFSDDKLRTQLAGLVDAEEKISIVSAYKVKLSKWQLTQLFLFHMVIILRTEDWWWSIEKNDEGITIQRSKWLTYVKDNYRQKERNPGMELMKEDRADKSVNDLIDWLWKSDELNNKYNLVNRNCQDFGKKVFNFVAASERFN